MLIKLVIKRNSKFEGKKKMLSLYWLASKFPWGNWLCQKSINSSETCFQLPASFVHWRLKTASSFSLCRSEFLTHFKAESCHFTPYFLKLPAKSLEDKNRKVIRGKPEQDQWTACYLWHVWLTDGREERQRRQQQQQQQQQHSSLGCQSEGSADHQSPQKSQNFVIGDRKWEKESEFVSLPVKTDSKFPNKKNAPSFWKRLSFKKVGIHRCRTRKARSSVQDPWKKMCVVTLFDYKEDILQAKADCWVA